MNLQALAIELVKIAEEAGKAILKIYREAEDFQTQSKKDASPLTIADKASNTIICQALEKLPDPYPIISEENEIVDFSRRQNWYRCWLVDPLDGTKEFINRNGDFTVNIALVENHKVILGVVHIPVSNKTYYAITQQGAFQATDQSPIPLTTKAFSEEDAQLIFLCSRSHLNEETKRFMDKFKDPVKVSRGSSLKFISIAENEAHIYPRMAPTMEWDTAAAQIILEEAGGQVVVAEDGSDMKYNKENLLNPYFIAYGKRH